MVVEFEQSIIFVRILGLDVKTSGVIQIPNMVGPKAFIGKRTIIKYYLDIEHCLCF